MGKTIFIFATLLVLLSGCAADNTITVNVYVHEKDNPPAKGIPVNAYTGYSFKSASGPEKWLSFDGMILASRETDEFGTANMRLASGKYAFFARSQNGHFGGTEQFVSKNGERIEITLSGG